MSIFDLFDKLKKDPAGPPEFLIAGLGNPGKKYENTRHNAGWLCLDHIAKECGAPPFKTKWNAQYSLAQIAGRRCVLLKPLTFMNNSGEAVAACAGFYRIPPEKILILFDDVSFDPGKTRFRRSGSDGGHNGCKSVAAHLGADGFARIKIGVGKKPSPQYDLAAFVLSPIEDFEAMQAAFGRCFASLSGFFEGNYDAVANILSSK